MVGLLRGRRLRLRALVVGGMWGGPQVILSLASSEALFVYSIFAPAGAVFGAGFARLYATDTRIESEGAA